MIYTEKNAFSSPHNLSLWSPFLYVPLGGKSPEERWPGSAGTVLCGTGCLFGTLARLLCLGSLGGLGVVAVPFFFLFVFVFAGQD